MDYGYQKTIRRRPWYRRIGDWTPYVIGALNICMWVFMGTLLGDFLHELAKFIGYVPWWTR